MGKKGVDSIEQALNLHGTFLKQAVQESVEKLSFVKILGEELAVRYLDGMAIDLLVEVQTAGAPLLLVIECKRAYAEHKDWIFFESFERVRRQFYKFEGESLKSGGPTVGNLPVTVEGIEIVKEGHLFKANPTPIWDTAYQVCKAAHGFLWSEWDERKKVKGKGTSPLVVMPLVVTTAELLHCNRKEIKVDLARGTIDGKITKNKVPAVILNFPFAVPAEARTIKLDRSEYVSISERGALDKEPILITNSTALPSLLESLAKLPL